MIGVRILFDYHCPACAWTGELRLPAPAPRAHACPSCGGAAHRRYTTAGLARSGAALTGIAPAAGSVACRDNADVPGLCHVAPGARRALLARHRGDTDTYQRERRRQQQTFETHGPPPLDQVFTHSDHDIGR